jgi:hypothetical protein
LESALLSSELTGLTKDYIVKMINKYWVKASETWKWASLY